MKHPDLTEKLHTYARALTFRDICPQFFEQRLDISPLDIGGDRVREDRRKGFLVLTLHGYSIK